MIKLPRKIFVHEDLVLALRGLLMAICSGSIWLITVYSQQNTLTISVFGILTASLLIGSTWVAFRPVPKNRNCRISPTIEIPRPLLRSGINTATEHITYVLDMKQLSKNLHFVTNTRSGVIKKSWFTDSQWKELKANLPENPQLDSRSTSKVPLACLLLYIGLCASTLRYTEQSVFTESLGRLLYGAHNWTLFFDGEFYRLLSYSFLHHNLLHFLGNSFGIIIILSAIQRAYSNFSITALIGFSAMLSAAMGTALKNFDVMTGASGAIFGMLGFLTAAQMAEDLRLHPMSRIFRKGLLGIVLAFELILSFIIEWYGGLVHLAGFATGFLYYRWFESPTLSIKTLTRRRRIQWAVLTITGALFLQWVFATYQNHTHPYQFVDELMAFDDPVLTALAAPAVPDNPDATLADVERAKAQALAHLPAIDNNAIGIARADFWLGNNKLSRERMRKDSIERPEDRLAIKLWLATEKNGLDPDRPLLPDNILPAGKGGALLVSEQGDYIARLPFQDNAIDLTKWIHHPPYRNWSLIARVETLPESAQGVWPLKANQYRTRDTASSANH